MRIIDRLDKYMIISGLNDNKVTVTCSLSVGLLGKARKGNNDIGKQAIEKILKKYQNINHVWLLTGEGEMLKEKASNQPTSTAADDNVSMSREVFNLIVSQQSALKDQQATISNQNTVSQKNLETIQESIKMMLELMTKLTLQQTQISTSAQEEENVECADAV